MKPMSFFGKKDSIKVILITFLFALHVWMVVFGIISDSFRMFLITDESWFNLYLLFLCYLFGGALMLFASLALGIFRNQIRLLDFIDRIQNRNDHDVKN